MMLQDRPKAECCGCGACSSICPRNCITMEQDEEGFRYPILSNPVECIDCNLCNRVCSFSNTEVQGDIIACYCAQNKKREIVMESTSGGIFTEIASYVLKHSGSVWGVEMNNEWHTVFTCITSERELDRIRGSKYVECYEPIPYTIIQSQLASNRMVLFSGTPCQVKALKQYLQIKGTRNLDLLFTVDLFCYGVQSNLAWGKYLKEINPEGKACRHVFMRSKKPSWEIYSMDISFQDGTTYKKIRWEDSYLKSYSKGLFNRPSCSTCGAKRFPKVSDITLGDFWAIDGLRNYSKNIKVQDGVSIIIVNSEKGMRIIDSIAANVYFTEIELSQLKTLYPHLGIANKQHAKRKEFMKRLCKEDFSALVKEYVGDEKSKKKEFERRPIKRKVKRILNLLGGKNDN